MPRDSSHVLTGSAAKKAIVRASGIESQKTGFTSPASMAPGTTAITALSTTSIVAMDRVSAARTTLSAAPTPRPARSSGRMERV